MMKYYRLDDLGFNASEQKYVDYIRSIWDLLPTDLQRLYNRRAPFSPERIYLNDSNVQSIQADFGNRTVKISLVGESLSQTGTQIGTRLFTLRYGLVQGLTCDGNYENDFQFGSLHSDHIWDEIELLEAGLFEHRMLFAGRGRVEMSIIFGDFSINYADTLHPRPSPTST